MVYYFYVAWWLGTAAGFLKWLAMTSVLLLLWTLANTPSKTVIMYKSTEYAAASVMDSYSCSTMKRA